MLTMSGCFSNESDEETLPQMETSPVRVEGVEGSEWSWDLSIEVTSLSGPSFPPSRLKVEIFEFFAENPIYSFDGLGPVGDRGSVPVAGHTGSDPDRVRVGDRIFILGIQEWSDDTEELELIITLRDVEWKDEVFNKTMAQLPVSPVLVVLEPVRVLGRTVEDLSLWDISFELMAVNPDLVAIPHDGVQVKWGTDWLTELTIEAGGQDWNQSTELRCVCERGTYVISLHVGDVLIISSLTEDQSGGWVYLLYDEGVMGSAPLPDTWQD
jgi:hypothetical protein